MPRDDGFTLIELILVLTIIALVMAVVVSRITFGPTETHIRASAKQVAAGLRSARGEAVRLNREALFTLDVKNRSYRVGQKAEVNLSENLALALYTATSELVDRQMGHIRFFPDGSSTGGHIRLKRPDDDAKPMSVYVDWLSGRVSISD